MRSSDKNQAKSAQKTQLSLHEAQLPELEWSAPTQEGEGDTTEERQQATSNTIRQPQHMYKPFQHEWKVNLRQDKHPRTH